MTQWTRFKGASDRMPRVEAIRRTEWDVQQSQTLETVAFNMPQTSSGYLCDNETRARQVFSLIFDEHRLPSRRRCEDDPRSAIHDRCLRRDSSGEWVDCDPRSILGSRLRRADHRSIERRGSRNYHHRRCDALERSLIN